MRARLALCSNVYGALTLVLVMFWDFHIDSWSPECRADVNVPEIRMVDAVEGVLGIEWINGKSVRFVLGGGAEGEEVVEEAADAEDVPETEEAEEEGMLAEYDVSTGVHSLFIDLINSFD